MSRPLPGLRLAPYSTEVLHGRDDVVSMVQRWLSGLESGAGGSLQILGIPGVGKTAILDWAQSEARRRRMRVLRVVGHPEESALAWGGLSQVVTPFLASLDEMEPRPRSVLMHALRLGEVSDIDDISIGMALLLLLTRSDEPVAVFVDDVQWLDVESCRVLGFVARRLHSTGVGLMLASHPQPALAPTTIDLAPLDLGSLRAIARDHQVVASVADVLAGYAEGLPYALEQMIQGLDADQRSGARPLPEPISEIGRVDDTVAARLDEFGPILRRALAIIALAPSITETDLEVAIGEGPLDEVLRPACDRGVLERRDSRHVFTHPTVRTAAARLDEDERRTLHRFLATVTGPSHAPWHLAAATTDRDDEAAAALDSLATDAEMRGAHLTALRARQRAMEIAATPDPVRLLAAARNAVDARLPEVAEALLVDAPNGVETRALAADCAWVRGQVAIARDRWTSIIGDPTTDADLAMSCRRSATRAAFRMYDMPGVQRLATGDHEPHTLRPALEGDDLLRLMALGAGAIGGIEGAGADLVAHAYRLVESDPDAETIATLTEVVTLALARSGYVEDLAQLSERVGDLAGDLAPHAVPALLIARASQRSRSDLVGSVALAREALALAGEWDLHEHRPFALAIAVIGEASIDGPDVDELISQMRAFAVPVAQAVAAYAQALVHYGRGEHHLARDVLVEIHDRFPTETSFGFFWHHDLVDIALRCEDQPLARRVADDLAEILTMTNSPWVHAAMHRVRGLMAPDRDLADQAFGSAIEQFLAEGYEISAARCRLDRAERLRRDRQRSAARIEVERARDTLAAAGARRWVQRCDLEAAALGMVVADRSDTASTVLTSRELQVARWLVAGLTFKQIGARLFLSPRTVESHGQTVYRKLGVRGRAELAQLAREDTTLAPPPP